MPFAAKAARARHSARVSLLDSSESDWMKKSRSCADNLLSPRGSSGDSARHECDLRAHAARAGSGRRQLAGLATCGIHLDDVDHGLRNSLRVGAAGVGAPTAIIGGRVQQNAGGGFRGTDCSVRRTGGPCSRANCRSATANRESHRDSRRANRRHSVRTKGVNRHAQLAPLRGTRCGVDRSVVLVNGLSLARSATGTTAPDSRTTPSRAPVPPSAPCG